MTGERERGMMTWRNPGCGVGCNQMLRGPVAQAGMSPGQASKGYRFKTHFCLLMSMFLVKQFNCLGLSFLICKTGRVSNHVGWWCETYSRCYGILMRATVSGQRAAALATPTPKPRPAMGCGRALGIAWCLVLEARRAICSAAGPCLGSGLVLAVADAQSSPVLCSLWKGL